jgi:hypothetical protein
MVFAWYRAVVNAAAEIGQVSAERNGGTGGSMATTNTERQESEAISTTERAKAEASQLGDAVQREAEQVVHEAKDQTRQLLTEAKGRLREEARRQGEHTAENLRGFATDLHGMVGSADNPQSPVASWMKMGADGIDSLAARLDTGGFEGLMRDVGDFARRNPSTFLVGAFSAGFLAGRIVKNADTERLRAVAMSNSGMRNGEPSRTGGTAQ